jgi:FkbM family methyltransferase
LSKGIDGIEKQQIFRFTKTLVIKKVPPRWEFSDYLNPDFLAEMDRDSIRTIVELGCHDGVDTIKLRDAFQATVHAFECHPELIDQARQRCASRPEIHLVEKAAWDQDGTIPFYPVICTTENGKVIDNIGASSCFPARTDYHRRYEQRQIQVECMRLDTYWRQQQLSGLDLLCLDVQGAALHALRGLGSILSQVRYIIAEIEHRPIYEGQDLYPEIHHYLEAHAFRPVVKVIRDDWFSDYLYVGASSRKSRRFGKWSWLPFF